MADDVLVIFDLDGTLVDSEVLCQQALLSLLPMLDDTAEAMVCRYRGMQFSRILHDIARRTGQPIAADFESRYRLRVAELFASELQAMPGVPDMLRRLVLPCCIASSGPLPKIRQALQLTGLAAFFGDRLYSAYQVGHWKPHPGLFLHAAQDMGFATNRCIVVEDSAVGLAAAHAAGMHAFHYAPTPAAPQVHANSFSDMRCLPDLLATTARRQSEQTPDW